MENGIKAKKTKTVKRLTKTKRIVDLDFTFTTNCSHSTENYEVCLPNNVKFQLNKENNENIQRYKINVTKLNKKENVLMLDDKTGEFYVCRCNQNNNITLEEKQSIENLQIIKLYVCSICSAEFYYKQTLNTHINNHMEHDLYEMVLDMEEDYFLPEYTCLNSDYETSITNILNFLDEPYNYFLDNSMFFQTTCKYCGASMNLFEHEHHLTLHFV